MCLWYDQPPLGYMCLWYDQQPCRLNNSTHLFVIYDVLQARSDTMLPKSVTYNKWQHFLYSRLHLFTAYRRSRMKINMQPLKPHWIYSLILLWNSTCYNVIIRYFSDQQKQCWHFCYMRLKKLWSLSRSDRCILFHYSLSVWFYITGCICITIGIPSMPIAI